MRADPKHRRRFHRTPDCHQLTKGVAKGEDHQLLQLDLTQCQARPCATCYPDAPRVKMRHPYCPICESTYACRHNGGVEVVLPDGRHRYLWPDSNQMPYYRHVIQEQALQDKPATT